MKKIISLIAAVSMACSALVTSAYAADVLTVESTTKILTNEEFVEFYEEDIPEGKTAYLVSFEVAGLPELGYAKDGGTNKKPTYGGTALDAMEIILTTTDDMSGVDKEYSYIVAADLADYNEGFGEGLWSANYAGNFIYPAAANTTVTGKTEGYMQMCFVVDADDEITFKTEGTLSLMDYAASNVVAGSQKDYTNVNGATSLTFSPATITLAPEKDPDPTEPVVTGTDAGVVVTDGVNGKVWNEVKVENTTLGTNYRAKFTDGEEVSIHKFQNFGEVGGTATFAVILNTIRDVANITLDIIYDAVQ